MNASLSRPNKGYDNSVCAREGSVCSEADANTVPDSRIINFTSNTMGEYQADTSDDGEDDDDEVDNNEFQTNDTEGSYPNDGKRHKKLSPAKASQRGSGKRSSVYDQEKERRREELRRARAERKRCREKERRSNVNKEYVELTSLLMKIDSSAFPAGDVKLAEGGVPASRLDLISRTVGVLERLHEENIQLKQKLGLGGVTDTSSADINNRQVEENVATGQSEAAADVTRNRNDMVGTLLVPVMVPYDFPMGRPMFNRDSSSAMARLPPASLLPLGLGLRGMGGSGINNYNGFLPHNFGNRGSGSYTQQSNLTNSYLPSEREQSVEVEAMLSLNRSMPAPAAQRMPSSPLAHPSNRMDSGHNIQQPRFNYSK